jgi:TPR repeat protein
MKARLFVLSALVASLSFTTPASAQTTASAFGNAGPLGPKVAGSIDESNIYCPIALESILPGDYYACEARAAYGREEYHKAISMLEQSAYWGSKDAQYVLGLTYFNGDMQGVPQNRPLGMAWFALAAERRNQQYVLAYAQARVKATPQELSQAQGLWKEMRLKYGDNVAASRAMRRFDNNIRVIDESAHENNTVYLQGFAMFPQSAQTVSNKLHNQAAADFENIRGTVKVGQEEWVQDKPTAATPSAASSPKSATPDTKNSQP